MSERVCSNEKYQLYEGGLGRLMMIFYQDKKLSNGKSGFNHTHNYAPNLHHKTRVASYVE